MTTQSLIPPTSREGFQRLLSRPSDALIPFLNSILAGRLTATITSIADTVQVIRSAPVMSTTATNQPERISQSLEQELRISELQSSHHHQQSSSQPSNPTEDPDREDKAEDSGTICYALVARTDKSEQIDVEIQVASRTLHQNEPEISGARMVSSHDSYMKMNRVYTITICDVPWPEMRFPIPSSLDNCWLFWLGPQWRGLGGTSGSAGRSFPVVDPAIQHCFVSLAIFRALTADNVHDQLEKILWVFANGGPKRVPRALPDWVQADPTVTLFVNLLLRNNDHQLGAGLEKGASDVPEIKHSSPVS
ncbi:hypothetical protein PGT21_015746 [Puccinia graminis f. sp. tritici]|uniref:Uncharacterized protein n=1 Tax=Puccinia graminis f. sp. tritici TaxID=56615 RepID=A0A5B0QTH8_PUCGR|nr:hypothetical protein PGT21_015746 [Puccinia graminis f. sp. tritici]